MFTGPFVLWFTLAGVTSVAYRHDVQLENLTFWLFRNYIMSDLMSNNSENER